MRCQLPQARQRYSKHKHETSQIEARPSLHEITEHLSIVTNGVGDPEQQSCRQRLAAALIVWAFSKWKAPSRAIEISIESGTLRAATLGMLSPGQSEQLPILRGPIR